MDEITVGFWVLFVILQLADALTTYIVITKLNGKELNPIMRKAFDILGLIPALILLKGLIVFLFWYYREQIPVLAWIAITVLYAWVINHNVKQIKSKQ